MNSLETELSRARDLSVSELADAIERIGFECTDCGACCKAAECGDASATNESQTDSETSGDESGRETVTEDHTATVFPDEVRELQARDSYDWRDVARPMPYGLEDDGQSGETFEWALQTDACGDCTFYDADQSMCTVYDDRPLICRTYPFSVALGGTSQPMGEAVDSVPLADQQTDELPGAAMLAHECEGLGRDIDRESAEELADALKERAVRELEEAISVRESYEPVEPEPGEVIVHDSEGAKTADGTPVDQSRRGR